MLRQLVAACGAVAMVMMLMPPAGASPDSRWSEWSAPVNLGAQLFFNSLRPGSALTDDAGGVASDRTTST